MRDVYAVSLERDSLIRQEDGRLLPVSLLAEEL